MGKSKSKRDGVTVDGGWFGVPCDFLESRACAELSPLAAKMLLTLLAQVRSRHRGNGRIDAHAPRLRRYGWTSVASARAALRELIEADLIVPTLAGKKGTVGLYGVTLFPMHCDPRGLEVGPGAWRVAEWRRRPGVESPPTDEKPAVWNKPRASKNANAAPVAGTDAPDPLPLRERKCPSDPASAPATGTHQVGSTGNAFPLRDSPLRHAICQRERRTRMGVILARRIAAGWPRSPAYLAARPSLPALALAE